MNQYQNIRELLNRSVSLSDFLFLVFGHLRSVLKWQQTIQATWVRSFTSSRTGIVQYLFVCVDNLDHTQRETLKEFWVAIISKIDTDSLKFVRSQMGDEFFHLIGQDDPDRVLLRWLRARKWLVSAAVQHMMDTLRWRCEWGLRKLVANGENDLNLEECASGKYYMMGKDRMNRPITYIHAGKHIKGRYPFEDTEKFIILYTETSRYMMETSIEEGTVVIDLAHLSLQNVDYQHIKFMITAAQNYYPECLGLALMANAPRGFNIVWKIVKPWMDPVVAAKVHFVNGFADLTKYIDSSSIPQQLGGSQRDFEYIPPTKEDQDRMAIIRQDKEGMEQAQLKHREAAQRYINVTLEWATMRANNEGNERLDRVTATEQLSDAFKQLLPYISSRTYYHRTGQIQEPMFDVVYDRICAERNQVSYL